MDEVKEKVEIAPEASLEQLKKKVSIRDQMGGALYYNILNDECCQLANRCLALGCNRTEIEAILGPGTFY